MLRVKQLKVNGVDYLHSGCIGTAPRTRVEQSVKEYLLHFDRDLGDYMITKKALTYKNFWNWLQGSDNQLHPNENIF